MMQKAITWHHPRVLSALACIFISGVAVGAMGLRYYQRNYTGALTAPPAAIASPLQVRSASAMPEGGQLLNRMHQELDLSPEQQSEMRQFLEDYAKYVYEIQMQMRDTELTGRERMARILREDQRQRFNEMMQQLPAQRQ
jgi:hypothetical protein